MFDNPTTPKSNCCSSIAGCCSSEKDIIPEKRRLTIDFLYLDLTVCSWCQGTKSSLDAAIFEVAQVLSATNIEVAVNKINVVSEEQAEELRFVSSPTIRVNGKDIQLEIKESLCDSCQDLCGADVDCRIWIYQDKEYTTPPKAMIIEAILREVYGNPQTPSQNTETVFEVPDNLKKFFVAMKQKLVTATANSKKSS